MLTALGPSPPAWRASVPILSADLGQRSLRSFLDRHADRAGASYHRSRRERPIRADYAVFANGDTATYHPGGDGLGQVLAPPAFWFRGVTNRLGPAHGTVQFCEVDPDFVEPADGAWLVDGPAVFELRRRGFQESLRRGPLPVFPGDRFLLVEGEGASLRAFRIVVT